MLKTFVMPHVAPITETFDETRAQEAVNNLIKAGGFELLARFVAVVDMGSSSALPQDPSSYYFVFGDVINGTPLIIADALKYWSKELRVSKPRKTTSNHVSKTTEEEQILTSILNEITNQEQKNQINQVLELLKTHKASSKKTPSVGTILTQAGKGDIVSVGRCVIKKLESEIRSKKDKKTGQVVLYRACDQLT